MKGNSMARLKKMICPRCGTEMNHHAEKLVYESGSAENRAPDQPPWNIEEMHTCPACGAGIRAEPVPDN
jgi:ribosomal protein S27AE